MIKLANIRAVISHSSLWQKIGVPLRDRRAINRWLTEGRPWPPPQAVKARNIMALADIFDADILVETGTFRGAMVNACLNRFSEIHSIEIHRPLARDAKRRFASFSQVRIYEGDSGDILPAVLPVLTGRTVFWLDGHYSGEGTGRGATESPIIRELASIRKFRPNPTEDIILIDDARCFNGSAGYPLISDFLDQLTLDFGARPYVADDAIVLLPVAPRS